MKILKKISGSFLSDIFLVEIDKQKYVLKRSNYNNEIPSEKKFIKILSENKIPALKYFENSSLNSNEILLEYINDSITLGDRFTEKNCKNWGKITRKMHNIKFDICFKIDEKNKIIEIKWSDYIKNKIKRAFAKAEKNNNYGFNKTELKKIKRYISPLSNIKFNNFSLIHGDLHANNVLVKKNNLILFDKNSEAFSGDPLIDLAIALIDMPNDTLVKTVNSIHKNDKNCLNFFIDGYGENFLDKNLLNKYVVLITFGRLYTPYSENYKEIILNIV